MIFNKKISKFLNKIFFMRRNPFENDDYDYVRCVNRFKNLLLNRNKNYFLWYMTMLIKMILKGLNKNVLVLIIILKIKQVIIIYYV